MAQEVIVKLLDDLDGTEAAETVIFGLDGESNEIDLSDKNAAVLRKSLDRYLASARLGGADRTSPASRRARNKPLRGRGDPDPRTVRAWANENGIEMSTRGRIPTEVLERYKASGGR